MIQPIFRGSILESFKKEHMIKTTPLKQGDVIVYSIGHDSLACPELCTAIVGHIGREVDLSYLPKTAIYWGNGDLQEVTTKKSAEAL